MIKLSTKTFFPFCFFVFFALGQSFAANPEEGRKLMESKKKGNCIACHNFIGAVQPGDMGPQLVNMKAKYTREEIQARVWDATRFNPISAMPPFGRNRILTKQEIEYIVDYLETI